MSAASAAARKAALTRKANAARLKKSLAAKKGHAARKKRLADPVSEAIHDTVLRAVGLEPAAGFIDKTGAHFYAKPGADELRGQPTPMPAAPVAIVTIASMLNDLDLSIDALEGRLARVLHTEKDDAVPNVGYSDIARAIHYAKTRIDEIAERVDI